MTRVMEVVPYDFNWPKNFENEAVLLKQALGDNCIEIYHIGSTSVPGLAAKPIIDIMLEVQNLNEINDKELIDLGYTPRGEMGMPFRRFYHKGDPRTHHIHIWEKDNPEIQKHLLFRDFLRSHPDVGAEYAVLKFKLAKDFRNDRGSYTESKDTFIKNIIQKSGFNGLTIAEVKLANEWQAYKKLQQNDNLVISDNDLFFILMHGAEIVSAAHIEKTPIMKIVSIKTDNPSMVLEGYMSNILERWIKEQLNGQK